MKSVAADAQLVALEAMEQRAAIAAYEGAQEAPVDAGAAVNLVAAPSTPRPSAAALTPPAHSLAGAKHAPDGDMLTIPVVPRRTPRAIGLPAPKSQSLPPAPQTRLHKIQVVYDDDDAPWRAARAVAPPRRPPPPPSPPSLSPPPTPARPPPAAPPRYCVATSAPS